MLAAVGVGKKEVPELFPVLYQKLKEFRTLMLLVSHK